MGLKSLPIFLASIAAGLVLTAPAAAECSRSFSKSGPTEGLRCTYNGDPESNDSSRPNWTVPAGVAKATFEVWGAPGSTGRGGRIRATLPVVPGETLTLALAAFAFGGANWVSQEGVRVLIAGGGDGNQGNYVAPGAENVHSEYPSASNPPYPNGEIRVTWIQPAPCVVPDIRGKQPKAARRTLDAAHCRAGNIGLRPAKPGKRGRVISQTRRPGAVLPQGTAVHLTVGRHP